MSKCQTYSKVISIIEGWSLYAFEFLKFYPLPNAQILSIVTIIGLTRVDNTIEKSKTKVVSV